MTKVTRAVFRHEQDRLPQRDRSRRTNLSGPRHSLQLGDPPIAARLSFLRSLAPLLAAVSLLGLAPALPQLPAAAARVPEAVTVTSAEVTADVATARLVALPLDASHVALHWRGNHHASVRVQFSVDGTNFGAPQSVEPDEAERDGTTTGETYSGVMYTGGATYVRISSDRPLGRVVVVAIDSRASTTTRAVRIAVNPYVAAAAIDQPAIISRAAWGADESLRFQEDPEPGAVERWPATFRPTQKLTVHHTAGVNDDPDPAATVRAIYYNQAVSRGWGDIGYNFLIDEAGNIYEGRHSRDYWPGEVPTGEDELGNGVTGAHVGGYNAGNMGVALLGTMTTEDATPAARAALEELLAWKAERHSIDPLGSSLYVNPDNGYENDVANISGHRDWAATECPGGFFYSTLPDVRRSVETRITGDPSTATVPGAPTLAAKRPTGGRGVALSWTVPDDGGAALTEYRVLRKRNGKWVRIAIFGPTATTYRDPATTRGRTYTYVIRAVNTIGLGPISNEAAARAR